MGACQQQGMRLGTAQMRPTTEINDCATSLQEQQAIHMRYKPLFDSFSDDKIVIQRKVLEDYFLKFDLPIKVSELLIAMEYNLIQFSDFIHQFQSRLLTHYDPNLHLSLEQINKIDSFEPSLKQKLELLQLNKQLHLEDQQEQYRIFEIFVPEQHKDIIRKLSFANLGYFTLEEFKAVLGENEGEIVWKGAELDKNNKFAMACAVIALL
ncbi:Hypothetical_protein [Hexamita inflata]|uniref:Hypothetical_protein n=1 Tax=Hexamita inflata TaxID=28002 RepID=A0AA86VMD6_9EUKA|nr:Hypothetical protein HINF_LOCUS58428 [Hexamita inflata]